jgi:hypothetical protein
VDALSCLVFLYVWVLPEICCVRVCYQIVFWQPCMGSLCVSPVAEAFTWMSSCQVIYALWQGCDIVAMRGRGYSSEVLRCADIDGS